MVTPDATRTADEMLFGSGAGDGTHVRWSKYRFYFVNKCSHPLNVFQKYRDDAPKWAFCQVPVESYGCPNNRDGAYLHTLDGGQDQATCTNMFEIAVNSTTGTHYDISIIPPGVLHVQIAKFGQLQKRNGQSGVQFAQPLHSICTPLKCLADGCQDAYQYPEDNTKDHGCRDPDAIYQVTFCPSST
ncbi:hypothetical protein H257_17239 [Aphanomyces astaci]|uniref:Uncharacterized protein n=1 Tax=Aphanomyces astaci TaxID=112090 RepID=W4FFP6_APHAT|nr:hypothetical protein H257_17239 [Aphanomyces astaci]ETV66270.1 hypothetical protein H257_17239 [Aphanomyces astaci]|eukprot:XP_009844257.1 hypothetical protein H257_17239 [Aphanomyces astaci]